MTKLNLLQRVQTKLQALRGKELEDTAALAGISYDTARRIRDGTADPKFSQLLALAKHLGDIS